VKKKKEKQEGGERGVTQEDFPLFLTRLQTAKRHSQGSVNEASSKDRACFIGESGELTQTVKGLVLTVPCERRILILSPPEASISKTRKMKFDSILGLQQKSAFSQIRRQFI